MAISFNTGAKNSANTAASVTLAIPAGVLANDVMIMALEVFCETGTTPTISFSGAGGGWTLVPMTTGTNPEVATAGSSIWSYGYAYYRVATAGDVGATLTITESGSAAGTTWLAVAMAAYTGASTTSPIDVAAGNNAQGTSSGTGPTVSTVTANDWALQLACVGLNGTSLTGPGTSRENVVSSASVGAAADDGNGPVAAGTNIGGGSWTQTGNTSNWWSLFTIGLAPPGTAVYGAQRQAVRPRIQAPHALGRPGLSYGSGSPATGIQVVQHASNSVNYTSGTSAATTVTFGSATRAGNSLVVCLQIQSAVGTQSVTSVTTNGAAENWAKAVSDANGAVYVYADPNTGGAQTVIDVNWAFGGTATATNSAGITVDAYEVSGLVAAGLTDKTTFTDQGSTSTSWTSGSTAATSAANEIWFGVVSSSEGGSGTPAITGPASPWVNEPQLNVTVLSGGSNVVESQRSGYLVVSSAGAAAYAGTVAPASQSLTAIATFRAAPAQATDNSSASGRVQWSSGAPVNNPAQGPVFRQAVRAVRAQLPQAPLGFRTPRGRVSSSPGAPVRNPVQGPVFVQKPQPARFILPPWQPRAGRIGSSFGAVVQNPSHGPPVYALPGPVRVRLPQFRPRAGRVTSNPGAAVRNPVAGPAFAQKTWPVQAPDPLPRRGRVYATVKPPVAVVPPPVGPPFYPAVQAVRARLPLQPLLRGRVTSNPAAPVQNPSSGPVFRQAVQPARARSPQLAPRAGRVSSGPGAAARNPSQGPVFIPVPRPARAPVPPVFSKGRTGSNAGGPVRNPVAGPVFAQSPRPAQARIPQTFSKGRVSRNAGAPVQNPGTGPVFRQAVTPARSRIILPPRGRTASNAGGPVQNPAPSVTGPVFYPRNSAKAQLSLPRRGVCRAIRFGPLPANPSQGPVFTQATSPARARFPLPLRGRSGSNAGGPVQNPPPVVIGPPFFPFRSPVRVHPVLPPRGRIASGPGAPVRNPSRGPAIYPLPGPVRSRVPELAPRAGRVTSNAGTPAVNPAPGPAVYPLQGPVRPRLPQMQPRAGRIASSPGAPVRNPVTGPAFRQAPQPARARVPQVFSKGRTAGNPGTAVYSGPAFRQATSPARTHPVLPPRGRVYANPGGPVQNPPPPVTGPVFRQATSPARIRPALPPRGRTASSAGAQVRNPVTGPPVTPQRGPVRTPVPQVFSKGRISANAGTPAPAVAPVYPWHGPVRIRLVLPPRGRASGNPGIPVSAAPRPAPVYPLHGPVVARRPLPLRGRVITGNPGAPARNPSAGPRFTQAVTPIRARIPQNAPRGRAGANPGGPVRNIPLLVLQIKTGEPYTGWASGTPYTGWSEGEPYISWSSGAPYA